LIYYKSQLWPKLDACGLLLVAHNSICSGSGRAAVSGPWPKNVLLANTSRGASIRVYLVIILHQ